MAGRMVLDMSLQRLSKRKKNKDRRKKLFKLNVN